MAQPPEKKGQRKYDGIITPYGKDYFEPEHTSVRQAPEGNIINPYNNNQGRDESPFWAHPVLRDRKGFPYCPGFSCGPVSAERPGGVSDPYVTNAWDYLLVDGKHQTPGACEVSFKKGRKVDKKKSAGKDGSTLTFTGIDNADVTLRMTIWTPLMLDTLERWWRFVSPPTSAKPKDAKQWPPVLPVKNPSLNNAGINYLAFIDRGALQPGGQAGSRTVEVTAVEYFKPGSKNTTITAKPSPIGDSSHDFAPPSEDSDNTDPDEEAA